MYILSPVALLELYISVQQQGSMYSADIHFHIEDQWHTNAFFDIWGIGLLKGAGTFSLNLVNLHRKKEENRSVFCDIGTRVAPDHAQTVFKVLPQSKESAVQLENWFFTPSGDVKWNESHKRKKCSCQAAFGTWKLKMKRELAETHLEGTFTFVSGNFKKNGDNIF